MQFFKTYMSLSVCTLMLFFPTLSFAMNTDYDPGTWDYTFHLQIKNGVLGIQKEAVTPYEATLNSGEIPLPPKNTDFHIDVIGVKGNLLGSYGFNDPKTYAPVLEKTIFDLNIPFFANGGRAVVFNRAGKKLFEQSLLGTSFCNDNRKCEIATGENFANCANDCPPPPRESTPAGEASSEITDLPGIAPNGTIVIQPITPTNSNESTTTYTLAEGSATKNMVIPLTIGVLSILLSLVGYIAWRKHKEAAVEL